MRRHEWMEIAGRSRLLQGDVGPADGGGTLSPDRRTC